MRKTLITSAASIAVVLVVACGGSAPPTTTGVAPRLTARPAAAADAGAGATKTTEPACGVNLATEGDPPADERGRIAAPEDPKLVCAIADSNIAAAESAILGARNTAAPAPRSPWDHRAKPAYMDLVERRFQLTRAERKVLDTQGFVVPARLGYTTYSWALHDIYQSQLPIYISVDAIMHAVYIANDKLIATIEQRLQTIQREVLEALACALPAASASYPPEVAKDLDVYLNVARSLVAGTLEPGTLGNDAEIQALLDSIKKAEGMTAVTLFGRARNIDWSLYKPRGHYVPKEGEADLGNYFRAATWLSRLELNLVSRACRSSTPTADKSETPREATVALALSDLAERANALQGIEVLDRAWGLLGGKREDVSIADLVRLRKRANITSITMSSADALRAAIGNDFRRTARLHYMPMGCSGELPAIATMLGPRVVPDSAATRPLVNPDVVGRYLVSSADMAYALGNDRAKRYLAADLAAFPKLAQQLDVARGVVQAPLPGEDLYSLWLGAIRSIARRPEGSLPSYMDTEAYLDLKVNSTVAAFGQIRHNYVLIAGQSYDEGGCEIPDGYVEPAPAVYDALLKYASRGAEVMTELDPKDTTKARAYFTELAKVLGVLKKIGDDELAGRPLSQEQKRFLSLVVEMRPGGTGGGPTYTGWYFDMFRTREAEGLAGADFIADYFTSGYTGRIAYAGAGMPRLGIFVVDSGGAARLAVGPVARAYEHVGSLTQRVTDDEARKLPRVSEPWAASYTVAAPAEPPIAFHMTDDVYADAETHMGPGGTLLLKAERPLGTITVELLDHHYVTFASVTQSVGRAITKFKFAPKRFPAGQDPPNVGALRIRIGENAFVVDKRGLGGIAGAIGGAPYLPY